MIIDCRYEDEYEGGHIPGAINLSTKGALIDYFFGNPHRIEQLVKSNTVIIFHCEFSERRAPLQYSVMRGFDREANIQHYPRLFYPEIYLLQGGFSQFFKQYHQHCIGKYVKMGEGGQIFSQNKKTQF